MPDVAWSIAARRNRCGAFRERHPDHAIVSYINTSVEVKAESDILLHLA